MSNYLLIAALALFSAFLFRQFTNNKAGKDKIIALKKANKSMFLVDVRQPEEFKSGSVKGAVNIPVGEVQSRIGEFKNKENIIVFCKSGMRSSQAASVLEKNGFKNIINGGNVQNVSSAIEQ